MRGPASDSLWPGVDLFAPIAQHSFSLLRSPRGQHRRLVIHVRNSSTFAGLVEAEQLHVLWNIHCLPILRKGAVHMDDDGNHALPR